MIRNGVWTSRDRDVPDKIVSVHVEEKFISTPLIAGTSTLKDLTGHCVFYNGRNSDESTKIGMG